MSNLREEADLDLRGRRLVICSNRDPYKVIPTDSGCEFEATKGGFASALLPVMRADFARTRSPSIVKLALEVPHPRSGAG